MEEIVRQVDDLQTAVAGAARVILSGGVVAFPTESFYGLAVNGTDKEAVERLFDLKNRTRDRPVLILIPSADVLDQYVIHLSEIAHQLIKRFWPGGLTLVFEAGPRIPSVLTAGTGKIGVRLSSHPIARALAKAVQVPITGTSANLSGRPACVHAREVFEAFGNRVDCILDGGETSGGKGSTILDLTVHPPKVLREGMISRRHLKEILHIEENSHFQ